MQGDATLQKAHRGNRKTWKRLSKIACETTKEPRPDTNQLDKTYLTRMCGRYDNLIPRNAYSALFRAVRVPRSTFPPRYNVAPTDQIPIIRVDPRDGERADDGALGPHSILDEGEAKGPAHQCSC